MSSASALDNSIVYLRGVGEKRAKLFEKLGVKTVRDLIYHLPRRYVDLSAPVSIAEAVLDMPNVVEVTVVSKERPAMIRKGMTIYKVLVTDGSDDMTVTIFNSSYVYDMLRVGEEYILFGKITGNFTRREMSSPEIRLKSKADIIEPVYPLTAGLTQNMMRICMKSALAKMQPKDVEFLPQDIVDSASVLSEAEALKLIHFPETPNDVTEARRRLAFGELLTLRLGMLSLREFNRKSTTFAMKKADMEPFYRALPFKLTGAQSRAISECMADMCKSIPMNRLILGDVGSGKTAVAAACIYFAAKNGAQSVLMAPTEILASQHYASLKGFLEPLGIKIALLKGSMKKKEKTEAYAGIASGETEVIVGTHAVIQEGVEYRRLGLVITDEQHRFGVEQRTALAKKGENPHRLVMSATPIPRTLALMIYGELDISVLDELPAGRKQIKTYAVTGKLRARACGYVREKIDEGGQAYIVCPAVEEGEDVFNVTDYAKELEKGEFKGYRIGVLHGRLPAAKKDEVMAKFKNGELDILVCTTVVEVGVDVPNASVMMVENADRFGLSQLHQLRGRVGRGERESCCILITDSASEETRKRLRVLSSTSSGFDISEADLEIRGPGDFFGSAQHGLPPVKIADLAADRELIALAQDIADNITDTGRITLPGCEPLRKRVEALFDSGVRMN